MKRWQWGVVAVFAGIVALEAVVYAQPAPNNCGLNMLCRVRTLIVSGASTFSGPVTFDGGVVVTGPTTINGDLTVNGDAGVADLLATNVTFAGGGTPCLTRGGNTTVQTCSGDGFASLGTLQGQGNVDVLGGFTNTLTGANCSSNTGAVCVNDAAGLAVANGSGTTVALITAAGLVSGDTGVSSGTVTVAFLGGAAVAEGANGLGSWLPTTIGRGSKLRQVCCSCRVTGTGGTEGIFLSLWDAEGGAEVDSVEIGEDGNACDDTAGTPLCGDFNYSAVLPENYTLQVKNTTDCAGNPTDCVCNIDVTR